MFKGNDKLHDEISINCKVLCRQIGRSGNFTVYNMLTTLSCIALSWTNSIFKISFYNKAQI